MRDEDWQDTAELLAGGLLLLGAVAVLAWIEWGWVVYDLFQ